MSIIDPWLAASPDGIIHDPRNPERIGIVEIKCPYKMREKTLAEACQMATFFLKDNKNKTRTKTSTRLLLPDPVSTVLCRLQLV